MYLEKAINICFEIKFKLLTEHVKQKELRTASKSIIYVKGLTWIEGNKIY